MTSAWPYNHAMATQPSKALEVVPNQHPDRDYEVSMVVPEFTAAAHAAAASDYVVGLPARAARAFCEFLPLELIELPAFLDPPVMNMALLWHPRTDQDAGARYFRSLVAEACREKRPQREAKTARTARKS